VVIGGGLTGSDVEQYYLRLGYEVHFIISGTIPGEPPAWGTNDPVAKTRLQIAMESENPNLIPQATVTAIEGKDSLLQVTLSVKGVPKTITAGRVSIARGFTGVRLEAAERLGVTYTDDDRIIVSSNGSTDVPFVYACGDGVAGQPNVLVHAVAGGQTAARSLHDQLMGTVTVDPSAPPWI
jgi:pyruvate/2-oxoglutarate dehydrogenase complex dihydrolipoamide dehydrogenase (E3) component